MKKTYTKESIGLDGFLPSEVFSGGWSEEIFDSEARQCRATICGTQFKVFLSSKSGAGSLIVGNNEVIFHSPQDLKNVLLRAVLTLLTKELKKLKKLRENICGDGMSLEEVLGKYFPAEAWDGVWKNNKDSKLYANSLGGERICIFCPENGSNHYRIRYKEADYFDPDIPSLRNRLAGLVRQSVLEKQSSADEGRPLSDTNLELIEQAFEMSTMLEGKLTKHLSKEDLLDYFSAIVPAISSLLSVVVERNT